MFKPKAAYLLLHLAKGAIGGTQISSLARWARPEGGWGKS
jgi:hypothetical protein